MAIPNYEEVMRPLLRFLGEGVTKLRELVDRTAKEFSVSEDERLQRVRSGGAFLLNNRVAWALVYLKKAGLVTSQKRAHYEITNEGRLALASNEEINSKFLKRYQSFLEFLELSQSKENPGKTSDALAKDESFKKFFDFLESGKPKWNLCETSDALARGESFQIYLEYLESSQSKEGFAEAPVPQTSEAMTPNERFDLAYDEIMEDARQTIIEEILNRSPEFFTRLIVDVLIAAGYGGSRKEAVEVLGTSGDGGFEGVIRQDRLGLDRIYIQAKRNVPKRNVGKESLQHFVSSMDGARAAKGVFMTTSDFTKSSREYANGLAKNIALINGRKLAGLMIELDVGVRTERSFAIKRFDWEIYPELR